MQYQSTFLGAAALALVAVSAQADTRGLTEFERVVEDTASMSRDARAQSLAKAHGLSIVDVTWEDTGRTHGSVWGPNISDMSIQVHVKGADGKIARAVTMPVIRYPNFNDKTCDLDPLKFRVLVGNERGKIGEGLHAVTLSEYLGHLRDYLTKSESWRGNRSSLLAERDTHVLVSSQVSFLPIPKGGEATFNPVLFNYQSYEKNPAVLTVLATREGTSATIVDNTRDAFPSGAGGKWGQRLFFNANGQRASLTGKRMSDFVRTGENPGAATPSANQETGLNMVLLIQVPLVHKPRQPRYFMVPMAAGAPRTLSAAHVEAAVIGHGELEGPFTEIADLAIERDTRFPIRVTVQFYKATESAGLTKDDIAGMRAQIDRVFKNADYVGSLVTEGNTGRPTEHSGPRWLPWWLP
jgi:hypothetical protein